MTAVASPAGTGTVSFAWFEVAVALAVAVAVILVARAGLGRAVARLRLPAAAAGTAVSAVIAAARADDGSDELVMRAAYELVGLLGLHDCRWVVGDDELPVARLEDDGSVHFGVLDWQAERLGLPLRGVHRPLESNGLSFGALVLTPRTYARVPVEHLKGAVTISDVVALGLHDRRTIVTPGAGS